MEGREEERKRGRKLQLFCVEYGGKCWAAGRIMRGRCMIMVGDQARDVEAW